MLYNHAIHAVLLTGVPLSVVTMLCSGIYRFRDRACTTMLCTSNLIRRRNSVCMKRQRGGVVRLTIDSRFQISCYSKHTESNLPVLSWYWTCTVQIQDIRPVWPSYHLARIHLHFCPVLSASFSVQFLWPKTLPAAGEMYSQRILPLLSLVGLCLAQCPYMNDGMIQRRDSSTESFLSQFELNDTNSVMTSDVGGPIGDQFSLKAGDRGPTLLEDFIFRQKIQHFDHERVRCTSAVLNPCTWTRD